MDTALITPETLEKTVRDLLERQDDLIKDGLYRPAHRTWQPRRLFARSLEEIWEQELPVIMAFIDIDNLKHCNDVLGMTRATAISLAGKSLSQAAVYESGTRRRFAQAATSFAILSTVRPRTTRRAPGTLPERSYSRNSDSEMPHSFSCSDYRRQPPPLKSQS